MLDGGFMFKMLSGVKVVLYALVFIRIFRETPSSFPLVLLALALIASSLWRGFYQYDRPKVNMFTLHLDLILAFLFSLFAHNGSFDKLFLVCLIEGIAVLPKPYWIAYTIMTLAANAGSVALYDIRDSGLVLPPEFAQILLIGFIIMLVISERMQREQRLAYEKLSEELRYLNLQLQESIAWSESLASEAERQRIAGEIHDSLGHDLTGLILTLEAGKRLMSRDVEAGNTYLDKALQVSRKAIYSVRELVSEIKQSDPEFELIVRLKEMIQGVQDLSGLKIVLDFTNDNPGLSVKEQFNIYRVFQEALTNTLRHANADLAQISIGGDRNLCLFSYEDNGSGTNQIKEGNGLKGMIERITDIGGTIKFESEAGIGFRIAGCIDRRGKEL
ncbi:MAG: hypothetical protein CVU90_01870 [Firmicutes bacterium HGW-Firmicutes-15]|nr:MAG: hypothetical protein CVU90_01870 [Firmicutes bacterium HGW-Firmicutes-15]